MGHTPSLPLNVDMGWCDNKRKAKRCISCGQKLPQAEQEGNDYYHCSECGYVSLEYQT